MLLTPDTFFVSSGSTRIMSSGIWSLSFPLGPSPYRDSPPRSYLFVQSGLGQVATGDNNGFAMDDTPTAQQLQTRCKTVQFRRLRPGTFSKGDRHWGRIMRNNPHAFKDCVEKNSRRVYKNTISDETSIHCATPWSTDPI